MEKCGETGPQSPVFPGPGPNFRGLGRDRDGPLKNFGDFLGTGMTLITGFFGGGDYIAVRGQFLWELKKILQFFLLSTTRNSLAIYEYGQLVGFFHGRTKRYEGTCRLML